MLGRFASGMRITIENEVADKLGTIIRPCGFDPYDPDQQWSVTAKDISDAKDESKVQTKVTKQSLTFPYQGYIMILYEK